MSPFFSRGALLRCCLVVLMIFAATGDDRVCFGRDGAVRPPLLLMRDNNNNNDNRPALFTPLRACLFRKMWCFSRTRAASSWWLSLPVHP